MTLFPGFAIVSVPFPFTDRQAKKRRPALVISVAKYQQSAGHILLAMITSAEHSSWPFPEGAFYAFPSIEGTGLSKPCLIRLKLFSLDQRLILNQLGQLSALDQQGVCDQLKALLAEPQR